MRALHLDFWSLSVFISAVHFLLALIVCAHIVLTKPDVRAALGWVGLVVLAPVIGSVLYALLGINRLRREAGRRRRGRPSLWLAPPDAFLLPKNKIALPEGISVAERPLATLVSALTNTPLLAGNAVDLLVNGDEAYPAMIAAIEGATRSLALATYIFDRGQAADEFIEALSRSVKRGVAVRVLIDGVGARYSHPSIVHALRAQGIRVARFLPTTLLPWRNPYLNLRNHRKLLVVDGEVAFCGGLNIRDSCVLALKTKSPVLDLHFRFRGPVVGQIMAALAFDWTFTTRETLAGPDWFPTLAYAGDVLARGIPDGPDEDYETLPITILGALSQATRSVRIVTPYFIPDPTLIDALRVAALRGIQVDVLLPARGNLRFVQWAATAQLSQIVRWGCRVHLTPPPFDHSKLFLVDGAWALVGSANWDPRSLRLNFEYAVECYSREFVARLDEVFEAKLATARPLTLEDLEGRSLPVKLRDGIVRLAQPYL